MRSGYIYDNIVGDQKKEIEELKQERDSLLEKVDELEDRILAMAIEQHKLKGGE